MTAYAEVGARLARVRERIEAACARADRDPAGVHAIAVSKRHPVEAVLAAYRAGARAFGENYAQELAGKRAALADLPDAPADIAWHFIGKLQRNKAKLVVGAALIHAVDSERLAHALARRVTEAGGATQPVLVAVNLAGEASKSGVVPDQVGALIAAIDALQALSCRGLMCLPPLPERPEDSRPHFRALRALRDRLATAGRPLPELSMGTTGDFEIAIEEGATLVRVGTAVFGPRPA